jgi:hypothetical protein
MAGFPADVFLSVGVLGSPALVKCHSLSELKSLAVILSGRDA